VKDGKIKTNPPVSPFRRACAKNREKYKKQKTDVQK